MMPSAFRHVKNFFRIIIFQLILWHFERLQSNKEVSKMYVF
jgi:hypothetical protein